MKIIICMVFLAVSMFGQSSASSPGVSSSGSVTPNNCAKFVNSSTIADAGSTCGGSGGSPGTPDTSIQFRANSTTFGGDANFVWDNIKKSVTLGPTTNIGYLTLQSTPRLYSETTSTETVGGTRGPFTLPYDFSTYLNPSADSAVELFNENALVAVQSTATHNFTSELAGLHGECDHKGTGTVAVCIGLAGEAYNLGTSGTISRLTGVTAEAGSLSAATNVITELNGVGSVLTTASGNTVTNAYGLHVYSPSFTGTASNYAALQIDNPLLGGSANPNPLAINIANNPTSNLGTGLIQLGAVNFLCPTMSAPATGPAWYCGVASPLNRIIGSTNGADFFLFNMSGAANTGTLNVGNLGGFTWSVGTANNLTSDTGITRDSAGVVDIGTGAQGSKAGTIQANLYTQALNGGGAQLGNASGSATTPTYAFLGTNGSSSGMFYQNGNSLGFSYAGNFELGVYSSYTQIPNANGYCWTLGIASNPNTCIWRTAQGAIEFGNSNTANSNAVLSAAGYTSVGTKFTTNNGCTDASTTGGATAGKFAVGAAVTSCTEVITMGNSATAPNGWSCTAIDLTTLGDVTNPHQTATNATTATIVTGTIVASDVIQFSCIGY